MGDKDPSAENALTEDVTGALTLRTSPPTNAAALPIATLPARRRDAMRNRERVLCAAQQLVSESGTAALDIRDVAAAARVGVGTVYRRFGDKAGLLAALLSERERLFQDRLIGGSPPLGPGAPPRDRLVAFMHELATLTEQSIELLCALQKCNPATRFRGGPYKSWKLHATILLIEAAPGIDAGWFADLLLAPLAADLFDHQRHELEVSREQLRRNLTTTVDAIIATAHR